MNDRLAAKGMCSGSRDFFKFWEISDNISETGKIETWFQWKSNRKSYVACRMAQLSAVLMTFKVTFAV